MQARSFRFIYSLIAIGVAAPLLIAIFFGNLTSTVFAQCGGSISLDDSIIGTISRRGGACWYTFRGEKGNVITIRMTRSSSSLDPWLALYDPSGTEVKYDDDSAGNRNSLISSYSLNQRGTYEIKAGSYDNASAGSFTLQLSSGSRSACVAPITPGRWVSSQIASAGQRCEFTFYGSSGDVVSIAMARQSRSSLDPWLDLEDPVGDIVASDDDGYGDRGSHIKQYRLRRTGTYTIVARSYQDSTAGGFDIYLYVH